MKMKKVLALLLASVMSLSVLAGCGSSTNESAQEQSGNTQSTESADSAATDTASAADNGEIVTLKWVQVGSGMPQNYDAWKAHIDEYLAEKIGVNIEVEVVSWGDWSNRRNVITSSGEDFDILFTDMDKYVSEIQMGAFMDMTELLETAGPELKALIPEKYWDAVKVNDKIYAVPTYKDSSVSNYWVWDQAILDKYSIDPAAHKTVAEMTEPLKTVYDGEGVPPMKMHRNGAYGLTTTMFDNVGLGVHVLGVRYDDETRTIVNGLEDEELLKQMDTVHEWYKYGIINADAATTDETDEYKICGIYQGWSGAAKTSWGPNHDMEATAVQIDKTVLSNSTVQGSLNAISANCKNPEKAMEFLQLMNTDTYLRDSFYYGLEGDDWDYTEDGRIHRNKTDWSMAGYTQGTFFIVSQLDTADFNQWDEVQELNENATPSPLLGFTFDPSSVETELANVRAVWEKYKGEFLTGTKEPRAMAKVITDEMEKAGLSTLLAEVQAQVDAQFK